MTRGNGARRLLAPQVMHKCAPGTAIVVLLLPLVAAARPDGDLPVYKLVPNYPAQSSDAALRGFINTSLSDAMRRHANHVSQRSHGRRQFDEQRFVERYARRLLREGGRIDGRMLPETLPLLPVTSDPGVQQVIDGGKGQTRTAKELYLYLERQTAGLRGSSDPGQQNLAGRLNTYLAGYKDGWAAPWIASRLEAFTPSSVRFVLDVKAGVDRDQRRRVGRQIAAARTILRRTLHPALLERIGRVPLRVDPSYAVAGIVKDMDGSRAVTLRPDSSVKDVLHELGHFVGYRGGLRALAAAHAVLSRRAQGSPAEPLSNLIPNTSYTQSQVGYRGGFADPYIGRHYADGYTEVLSMGLEHLATPRRAAELFKQDGEHFLLLLKVLQRAP